MPKPVARPFSKAKVQVVFGSSLRAFREERALTQQGLAELADLHTNYVSSVERGERNLSLHNITKLAHALKIPVATLMASLDA